MNDKKLTYINAALAIGLIAIIAVMFKTMNPAPARRGWVNHAKPPAAAGAGRIRGRVPAAKPEEPIYDISKIKGEEAKGGVKEPVKNLGDVYKNFPQNDAGDNMIDGWAKVDPKDRAKFTETLDSQIANARITLKANPEDKKTKGMLFISEKLKELASSNFNYNVEKEANRK